MNHNNYFNVNYNYYEKHLFPFGKKVLQVLIQNCRKEHESYKNNHTQTIPVQRKRVLKFQDSNTYINRSSANHQTNSRNDFKPNTQFNITNTQYPSEDSTKSTDFLKTVDISNVIGTEILASEDLVHTVIIQNNNGELNNFYNNEAHDEDIDDFMLLSKNNEVLKETNTVAWDNIFDTQLLVSDRNVDELPKVLQSPKERQFIFDVCNPNGNNLNINPGACDYIDEGNKQKTKHKKTIKSIDSLPNKSKKNKDNPNSFRKQKYTKVVKNWLNDVNPNNPIDEEAISDKQPEMSNSNNGMILEKTNNRGQNKMSKKVVQAQLANKDGIMKFSKPKKVNIDSGNKLEKGKTLNTGNDKDKKTKTKFVAPIKSQTPVKEVIYEIHIVNGIDFRKYYSELTGGGGEQEYVAVLVYSNHFNQLNCHRTDDSCDVDGVMININNVFYYFKGVIEDSKEILAAILDSKLICYEGKHVINYLASKLNMEKKITSIIDAKIGVSLLNPDDPPDNFSEVQKLLSFTPQYTIATECPLQKCAWYITLLKECVVIMTDMLIQHSLWNIFVNIEMRLLPVVAAMERRGVMVDLDKLTSMENILITKMKTVEQSCYKAAGRSFQINSPLQIRAILYEELQLDIKGKVKIRETLCKGAKSTSETMLRSLVSEHPLPRLILEYRHLHKAHATFVTGITHHVKDGVVKPTWVQTAAVTGRIASNNPNLQAIPKTPFNLVMFPEDNNDDVLLKFRSVYTSRPSYTLVAADFKHVECRVFAHVAEDTSLLEALRSKQDLFRVLAAKWLKKPESEISSEDRERTKRIIYASLYGAGTRKLMDILNISYDQTLAIITSFNRTFPSLKSFGRSVVSRCEQNGGRLSTICGRVRQIKNIASEDFGLRSQAERQAVNFIVQGSAADLCKMAMIETNEQLGKCHPQEAHLLLQIHDELVWEVKDEQVHNVILIIRQVMEKCGQYCGMCVDLPIEIHTGKNWGEMTEHTT